MKTLIEGMEYWRSERPDEWKMDEFIRGVQQLQTKLTESEARVSRLYDALSAANEYTENGLFNDELNETPAQSLAAIKADGVRDFAVIYEFCNPNEWVNHALDYADNLEGK